MYALFYSKISSLSVYLLYIHIISILQEKNEVFNDSKIEKLVRGSIKSEVIRLLNQDDIVIIDGLNYIKGYR